MTDNKPPTEDDQVRSPFVDTTNGNSDPVSHLPPHGHNASTQDHVKPNPDLALHYSREHEHRHLHHGHLAAAHLDQHHDLEFSKGTTFERSNVPDASPEDAHMHHRIQPQTEKTIETDNIDAEKGNGLAQFSTNDEEYPKKHRFSTFYTKYRIFFHLFIWLVFTG